MNNDKINNWFNNIGNEINEYLNKISELKWKQIEELKELFLE